MLKYKPKNKLEIYSKKWFSNKTVKIAKCPDVGRGYLRSKQNKN